MAGPLIGAQLAEFGADVVKIENADGRGDTFRMTGTRVVIEKENGATETMASNWHNVNRGKRSLTLDLKSERGKAIFMQLAADADVFLQNFRPGVAEKLGIGYEDLSALNPELIYLSSSGFGESGPSSEQRVYDAVIQARAGIAALQRKGAHFPYNTSKENLDSPPPQIGMQTLIVDKITAYTSCQSILAALYARDARGIGGQHIKINMLDAALQYIWSDGMTDITFQEEERVEHTTSPLAPFHILPCADGHIQVVGWNAQPLFEYMAGRFAPEVLADDRFMLPSDRLEHWPEFIEKYRAALTANATVATMTEHLESYGDQPGQVPYGVVRTTALPSSFAQPLRADSQVCASGQPGELRDGGPGRSAGATQRPCGRDGRRRGGPRPWRQTRRRLQQDPDRDCRHGAAARGALGGGGEGARVQRG